MSIAQNAGIAGLKNFQVAMDVLGNNIANVNTTGYKSSSANFQDSLVQSLRGATSPGSVDVGLGGTNPMQLGTGTAVASVAGNFGQGSLQTTGNTTDMAIQGDAFFAVSDGNQQLYTRDGSFSLDAAGHLVMPGSGLILQGYAANSDGTISDTATVGNVTIPYDTASPAQATSQINFARNLNSDSEAQGTVLVSKSFLEYAAGNGRPASLYVPGPEPLNGLMNSKGQNLHLELGTKLTFTASSGGVDYKSTYQVQSGDTYTTLRDKFKAFLQAIDPTTGLEFQYYPNATMGALTVLMGNKDIDNLQVSSDNPLGASEVAQAFSFPSHLSKPINPYPHTDLLKSGAVSGQILRDSYTADGTPISSMLNAGDQITVNADVGGQNVGGTSTLTYNPATTTWQDLLTLIQNNLQLPGSDKTSANQLTVSMDGQGTDDNIPDGSIVVRGLPGTAFQLSDLKISVTNPAGVSKKLPLFESNAAFTETQSARDAGVATTSIVAYDSIGGSHDVSVTFTKAQTDNEWTWKAGVTGSDQITGGGAGKLTFGPDGTVSTFSFDDGSQKLQIAPGSGAPDMEINLDPGGSGKFSGLTQFHAATTAAAISQDGHAMGSLSAIAIGKDGIVTGQFSNGTTRSLAQVVVADFTNPGGLTRMSNSVYAKSANSGDPVLGRAGSQSTSTIDSGALELSNVDLASQFTDMITYQRGYQANAKVITTADAIMQELIGMMRG